MEWFETVLPMDAMNDPLDLNRIRRILFCILADGNIQDDCLNEALYQLQEGLLQREAKTYEKAFIYGDGRICRMDYGKTKPEQIYYLNCTASPVAPSHLLMVADRCMKEHAGAEPETLVILRQSNHGLNLEEEKKLMFLLGDKTLDYPVFLVTNKLHNDSLEAFIHKQKGRVFRTDQISNMLEYIRM